MKRKLLSFFLAALMLVGCFVGLGAGVLDQSAEPEVPVASTEPEVSVAPEAPEVSYSESSLYEALMACKTVEEFEAIADAASEEEISALTETELNALEQHYAELASVTQQETEAADVEETAYPTVNFTNVAPFGDPVVGKAPLMRTAAKAKSMALAASAEPDNHLELDKRVEETEDGYKLILEAFATGEKVITEIKEDIPTDIVLVLDQSGSMDENMNTYDYRQYTGRNNDYLYGRRHDGGSSNLYYKLDDGSYVSVSVKCSLGVVYAPVSTSSTNDYYDDNEDRLYAKVSGEYLKVSVKRELYWFTYEFTYTLPDGTEIAYSETRDGIPNFSKIDGNQLYLLNANTSQNVYTYTYSDLNGIKHTIGTSTGLNTQPNGFTLYERYSTGTVTKLNALKAAVSTFADSVSSKAAGKDGITGTDDDVNHRIAVVGFASDSSNYNNSRYENSEVFVGSTQYKYNNSNIASAYASALQSMNTVAGKDKINASINALDGEGGTFTNLGMEMANGILNANPVEQGKQRNRVIVVFTDGLPGIGDYSSTVANEAITQGNIAKNTYGATVYTVGIFDGANAADAGSTSGNETKKANWFMQNLSSNDGTPQNPSYYLSAGDSDALNQIFKQISSQIETGGSLTTLDANTVVRDVISPYFQLPDGAGASSITLKTASCNGVDVNGKFTFDKPVTADSSIEATFPDEPNRDKIEVTGFDYKENWVGTVNNNGTVSYRGQKLIIEIPIVVKDGFAGGNNVPTNGEESGIYADGKPVENFPVPHVNVPFDVNVLPKISTNDKVIYEGGSVNAASLYNTVNTDGWQYDFVDVTYTVKNANSVVVTGAQSPTDCTTYSVTATFKPIANGVSDVGEEAGNVSDTKTANVHVLKPTVTVTLNDVEKYYGDRYTLGGGTTAVTWTDETDGAGTMANAIGPAPFAAADISLSYAPDDSAVEVTDGKIVAPNTDTVINVTATNNKTNAPVEPSILEFVNQCGINCEHKGVGDNTFIVHPLFCTLTISKTVTGNNTFCGNDSFIFDVSYSGNVKDFRTVKAVIYGGAGSVTLTGLPVGSYTVTEDTNWSWRYTADNNTGTVTLGNTDATDDGTVTINNRLSSNKWLGDSAYAINQCINGATERIFEAINQMLFVPLGKGAA